MSARIRLVLFAGLVVVAARLVAMTLLHPLNWDEVEYFRATDWVRAGLVPYRDFWEHHTPLQWFLFAPVTTLTKGAGVTAILAMRWAQVPLWIVTFLAADRLMRRAGVGGGGRACAVVLALSSSLLMISAMEYRVDVLGNALFLGGLVLLLRSERWRDAFGAGVLFCLAGLANLRLGPLLAATALAAVLLEPRSARWGGWRRAVPLFAGVAAALAMALVYLGSTGSLAPFVQHVLVDNVVGERGLDRVPHTFFHRILIPFGIRVLGGSGFSWSGIDPGGIAILVLGVAGVLRALGRWRAPDVLFLLAVLQVANVAFIAAMKFVYHYHLQIAVLLMLPFVGAVLDGFSQRERARRVFVAVVLIAALWHLPYVVLRGKELELEYQDRIMREAHARTQPGDRVFDGVGWAIRREPAYRFWFLPGLVRQLASDGRIAPFTLGQWMADPPAAVITDRNAFLWLRMHPDVAAHVVSHYLPVWRNLLLPALSARVGPGESAAWIAPVDGAYRIVAAPELAGHPWFRTPLAQRLGGALRLDPRGADLLSWTVDGTVVQGGQAITVRRGARIAGVSLADEPVGVFLLPGEERTWFREPGPFVTLDAEGPRHWHVPQMPRIFAWK